MSSGQVQEIPLVTLLLFTMSMNHYINVKNWLPHVCKHLTQKGKVIRFKKKNNSVVVRPFNWNENNTKQVHACAENVTQIENTTTI